MIPRALFPIIREQFFKGKIILVYGPRQTGKTTLSQSLIADNAHSTLSITGDDPLAADFFPRINTFTMDSFLGDKKILFIDEAQRFDNPGLTIKLIADRRKDIQILATGSSSFELLNRTAESLTGRKSEFTLFPLSFAELCGHSGMLGEIGSLTTRMIFGAYPEIITTPGREKILLTQLSGSYLYKDLLMLDNIKKPVLLDKILKALSLQVGSEVSYNELSQTVGADKETVEKYIDLLEKSFVIFRLPAFSRNIRNEIKRGRKIYFLDNGIRNAVIGDYRPVEARNDLGALWENYLISERFKALSYSGFYGARYFWRTVGQQEIDYIEEIDGKIHAFEFKWNSRKKCRLPENFKQAYPDCDFTVVTPHNYQEFLTVNPFI